MAFRWLIGMKMRKQITLFDDQRKICKEMKSNRLLLAFLWFMFDDEEPVWLNGIEFAIFNSFKLRMINQKKKSLAGSNSHWWWRPRKTSSELSSKNNTQNNTKTTQKQQDNNTNVLLLRDISNDISIKKEIKEKMFDDFWTAYPHARKWKKQESKTYFLKQNPDEVMKQVQILKRKLKAWLIESKYIPACERWIRDFTPINDDVINQDLVKICRRHLNAWWDMKERSLELKQTFWDERINEIVKAIQQKNNLSLI